MKRTTITMSTLGAAAALLLLAAATDGSAQTTGYFFDPPATSVEAGPNIDFEVSSSGTGQGTRHAFLEVPNGRNGTAKTKLDAVATLNGQRGFGAFASVQSPSGLELAYGGQAAAAMTFLVQDPKNRDRVKVDVAYQAVADTGLPIFSTPEFPYAIAATTSFALEIGRIGTYGQVIEDQSGTQKVYMPTVGGQVAPILEVSGIHIRNEGDFELGFNELVLRSQGQEIQRKGGRGPLEHKQKITLDVPTNYVQLMTIAVYANTNGAAYLDPVVTANAENPEVVVTIHGAVDPDPSPIVLDREELLAAGIDPGPLEDVGLVEPEDAPTPSPGPSPVPSPSDVAIAFIAPLPDASYKLGQTVRTQLRLVDAAGAPIADAEAKALVKSCRVQAGVDAATMCARYDKRKDRFSTAARLPKGTPLGTHAIVARLLDASGGEDATAETPIVVAPRGRPRP
jgi:hypothetical protein